MSASPLTSVTGVPQPLPPALPGGGGSVAEPLSTGLGGSQAAFAEVLGRQSGAGAATPPTAEQTARNSAEQLVSLAFVQPLLKQLRETSMAAPPFAPTSGEKQMRSLEDAELARRIVHAARFPIVDRIAKQLIDRAGKDARGRSVGDERSSTPAPATAPTHAPGRPR